MSEASVIERHQDGPVCILVICRPQVRNALNRADWRALRGHLSAACVDPSTRVIVLTGEGDRAFCAGADLKETLSDQSGTDADELPLPLQALQLIEQSSKPIIAAINGDAVGGGCELALACHIGVCSRLARLGLPEIRYGLVPAAVRFLPQRIGRSAAFELLLLGELISALDAYRLGLVSRLTDPAQTLAEAVRLAHMVAERNRCNYPNSHTM